MSRDLYRQRCHHRRPSTCSATRAQRSRTASCRWPLVRARVRVRVRFRLLPVHSMRCHAAGTKGRHTAYFPPSPQATPHGSRLASAWMRACSPSPQTVSHRRMPLRRGAEVGSDAAEIVEVWEVLGGYLQDILSTYFNSNVTEKTDFWVCAIVRWKCNPRYCARSVCRALSVCSCVPS